MMCLYVSPIFNYLSSILDYIFGRRNICGVYFAEEISAGEVSSPKFCRTSRDQAGFCGTDIKISKYSSKIPQISQKRTIEIRKLVTIQMYSTCRINLTFNLKN